MKITVNGKEVKGRGQRFLITLAVIPIIVGVFFLVAGILGFVGIFLIFIIPLALLLSLVTRK